MMPLWMTPLKSLKLENLKFDIRYATTENFTGSVVFDGKDGHLLKEPWAHEDVANRLRIASKMAASIGLGLVIYDAFRPIEAQKILFDHQKSRANPGFVTNPYLPKDERICTHSRGVSLDISLTKDGIPLPMGSDFDEFSALSWHLAKDKSYFVGVEAMRNRLTLAGIMCIAGFETLWNEWWHYQLPNCHKYPVLSQEDTGIEIVKVR